MTYKKYAHFLFIALIHCQPERRRLPQKEEKKDRTGQWILAVTFCIGLIVTGLAVSKMAMDSNNKSLQKRLNQKGEKEAEKLNKLIAEKLNKLIAEKEKSIAEKEKQEGEYKKKKDDTIKIVEQNGLELGNADQKLRDDEDVMRTAIANDPAAFQYASPCIASIILHDKLLLLQHASEAVKSDKNAVIEAINVDIKAMEYASPALRSDKEFMLSAIQKNADAIKYIHETLKADKDIMLKLIEADTANFKNASEALKKDEAVALAAVLKDGAMMEYVADELKGKREFVLKAAKYNPSFHKAFKYIHDTLKQDKEIAIAAIKANPLIFNLITPETQKLLLQDKDIMLALIESDPKHFQNASEALKKDEAVALAAVLKDGAMMEYVADELKKSRDFVLKAEQDNVNFSKAFKYIDETFKEEREIALQSIWYSYNWSNIPDKLREDRAFALEAIKKRSSVLVWIEDEKDFQPTWGKRIDFYRDAIKENGWKILQDSLIDSKLKEDECNTLLREIFQSYKLGKNAKQSLFHRITTKFPNLEQDMEIIELFQ